MSANQLAETYRNVAQDNSGVSPQDRDLDALDRSGTALLEQCELMIKGRVNRFAGTRTWLRDDVQAQAHEAVLAAAHKWDDTKGPFISYARDAVTYQLIDLVETSGTLHIPRRMRDAARKDPLNNPDPELVGLDGFDLPNTDEETADVQASDASYMEDLARVCNTSYEITLAQRLIDPIVTRTVFGPFPEVTVN